MPTDRIVDLQHLMVTPPLQDAGMVRAARLDPGLTRLRLDRLRPDLFGVVASRGFLRADSPDPISPVAQPGDTTLFENAAGDQHQYLPRYRLRTTAAGRYDVNVSADPQTGGQWVISLGLEAFPAPELGDAARSAQVLSHQLHATLHLRLPGSSVERRLTASEVLSDARGPVVILRLGLPERDELLGAFMNQSAGARMALQRSFSVAIELPTPPHAPHLPVGRTPIPMRPLQPGPRVQPMFLAARPQAMHLAAASITMDRSALLRRRIDIDPLLETHVPAEPATAAPRYRSQAMSLPVDIPLWFDSHLHGYLYPGASPGTGTVASLQMHSVPYAAPGRSTRYHSYLQSSSNPTRFYFLPDAFRLARTEHAPFKPALAFVVDQSSDAPPVAPGDSPATPRSAVELIADVRPVTDGKRLLAAKEALRSKLPTTGVPAGDISLEPLLAPSVLRLGLPRDGRMQVIEVAAQVDLANGFQLSERFALDDFQDVFAALMAPQSAALLQGNVSVSTGLGGEIMVPVELNFHALEGPLFHTTETPDPATGSVAVQLLNQTGGALHIPALPVWLNRDGHMVAARADGLDLGQPIALDADDQLAFQVVPTEPWPADVRPESVPDAVLDTSAITSVPDAQALFAQTFDNSVAQETARTITVMTDAEVLASAQAPDKAVRLVIIEFRGNRSVRLSTTHLEETVDVPVALMDVLLRRDTEGQYEFRQTVVFNSGAQQNDGWRKSDLGLLFVPFTGGN